jgi:thymidylate synthase ThyX
MNNPDVLIRGDAITPDNHRITTMELSLPRCLLAQFNKHRAFVSNTASARAIPSQRYIDSVKDTPYVPTLTLNQKGMTGEPVSYEPTAAAAHEAIGQLFTEAVSLVRLLASLGIHKQNANRYLEPFAMVRLLVTATDWDNFFKLRSGDADCPTQDDFKTVANAMKAAYDTSVPAAIEYGEMYMPVFEHHTDNFRQAIARCARLSYLTHDGAYSVEDDERLYDRLLIDGHLTPFEHVGLVLETVDSDDVSRLRGLSGCIAFDHTTETMVYTRQFKGMYTIRHMIEDNIWLL